MIRSLAAVLGAAACTTSLFAQNCIDNAYRLHLVDSQGVEAPFVLDALGVPRYSFPSGDVYLAFSPQIPNGTYYVHVTTPIDFVNDAVLSTNDPSDRFVSVTNNGGVISLSLPFTNGQTPPVFGLGLGGVGQSLRLAPFSASPDHPCEFKAWFGDTWDLSGGPASPYLILGGFNGTTGQCTIRSYSYFTIGGDAVGDVCGTVFFDTNGNGVQDAGENGIAGVTVNLNPGGLTQQTGANGGYCFVDVGPGNFTVSVVVGSGYVATTPTSVAVTVNACAGAEANFGFSTPSLPTNGHTPGFWRNPNGLALVTQYSILATLPGLNLVNASGQYVAPATTTAWKNWLQGANATNMAYMLSAHLAAMHCNVVVGFVDGNAIVSTPTGNRTIASVIAQAIASLAAHPYTPTGSPWRAEQTVLKNILDAANNNTNWL